MLGPVQLVMIGLDRPDIPASLLERIAELDAGPAVEILDVLFMHRDKRGVLDMKQVAEVHLGPSHEPGTMITSILRKAAVARTFGHEQWSGPAHLFKGDLMPDPRSALAAGSSVIALLLEHRWALALRETAADVGTHPVVDGWIGRDVLKEVGLLAQDER